jgi:hypothetical protein
MFGAVRVLCCLAALGLAACSSDKGGTGSEPSGALGACLERPSQLPRAPVGKLPCELVPPGLLLE